MVLRPNKILCSNNESYNHWFCWSMGYQASGYHMILCALHFSLASILPPGIHHPSSCSKWQTLLLSYWSCSICLLPGKCKRICVLLHWCQALHSMGKAQRSFTKGGSYMHAVPMPGTAAQYCTLQRRNRPDGWTWNFKGCGKKIGLRWPGTVFRTLAFES